MENLEWKDKVDGQDDILAEDINAIANYANNLNDGKVDKKVGLGLSSNDFADEYKDMLDSRIVELPSSGYAVNTNLITSQAVYKMIKNTAEKWDTETFEILLSDFIEPLANSIPMQKIYETTVTEQDTVPITISEDMDGNPFKLDEAFICIKLPEPLTKSADWSGYINDGSSKPSTKCWFYFTANTTGKNFIAKAERMCEGVWFTQKFSNLTATATNNAYSSGYLMADVNYIDILTLHCEGIPVGSTVVVCGRKVLN